jgi:hypothetical protein
MAKPARPPSSIFGWHHCDDEIYFYAQSFHKAAQALAKRLELALPFRQTGMHLPLFSCTGKLWNFI